jgi:hypothetical protein
MLDIGLREEKFERGLGKARMKCDTGQRQKQRWPVRAFRPYLLKIFFSFVGRANPSHSKEHGRKNYGLG